MEVLTKGLRLNEQDPTRFFEFDRFKDLAGDFYLVPAYYDFKQLASIKDKKIVYLEFEEPNRFFLKDPNFNHIEYEDLFFKIFTICPFTSKWLNEDFRNNKRTPIFFPFNEKYIPAKNEKLYDVIYTGHLHSKGIHEIINDISSFNYRLVSKSDSEFVTNKAASYLEKLNLIAQSKVTIVHNMLEVKDPFISNVRSIKNFSKNEAYRDLTLPKAIFSKLSDTPLVVPQLKSRPFEAAFCRSLILCQRDEWNVIEQFFEPEKDFIYYKKGQLKKTLEEVLRNYNNYQQLINNAFEKANNSYTTEIFFNKYLKTLL